MPTFKWIGKHSGNDFFTDPANWRPNGVPGPADIVLFNKTLGGAEVLGNGTIDQLIVSNADNPSFAGNLTLLGATGVALVIDGSSASFDSGTVIAPTVVIHGAAPSNPLVSFDGTLDASSMLIDGAGDNRVAFVGTAVTRSVSITPAAGAAAILYVDNSVLGPSTWTNTRSVVLGGAGEATLYVADSTVRIGYQGERGDLTLGNIAGGAGTADVHANSLLDVANSLLVGNGGTGMLDVTGGGTVHAGALVVAGGSEVRLAFFSSRPHGAAALSVGAGTIAAGGNVQGSGLISSHDGIVNDGTITALAVGTNPSGYLGIQGNVIDNGAIDIDSKATIQFSDAVLGTGTITFASGGDADLIIGAAPTIDATLTGFATSDIIRALGVNGVSYDPASGYLTLLSNGITEGTLALAGSYAASGFQVSVSGDQGVITYAGTGSHVG